jgi:uncharacterized membrane protein YczE
VQQHLARSNTRRLVQLLAGLALFGASVALMVRARLGLGPWDVLHQGLAARLHIQIGWMIIAVSIAVLAAWVPLRQRPGVGTLLNAVLVGLFADATLALLPEQHLVPVRVSLLTVGVALNAVATAMYIGAGLGAGPRDGLMIGLAERAGVSIRLARTALEVAVLTAGWLLGGSVGIGTVAYAAAIGPLVHLLLPRAEHDSWHRLPSSSCGGATCRVHT